MNRNNMHRNNRGKKNFNRPRMQPYQDGRSQPRNFNRRQPKHNHNQPPNVSRMPTNQIDSNTPNNELNSVGRINNISMLSYMERRNLKGLMVANPRFHLMGFNNVPKAIKVSKMLADLSLHLPEIKPLNMISIHVKSSHANDETYDVLIGFNNIAIIKKLRDIFGTGTIDLYKGRVDVVMPNLEAYDLCEYNKVVTEGTPSTKQAFKLVHEEKNLINMVEVIERISEENFFFVSSICCVGKVTFITICDPSLVLPFSNAAESNGVKMFPCETMAFTGSIQSELLPDDDNETPLNASNTAHMTLEEIIKFHGFKSHVDRYTKSQKDQHARLIKSSLLETQNSLTATMNEIERNLDAKLAPLEAKLNSEHTKFDEFAKNIDNKLKIIMDIQARMYDSIKHADKAETSATASTTTTQAKKGRGKGGKMVPLNPPTSGMSGHSSTYSVNQLEEEIDNTRADE